MAGIPVPQSKGPEKRWCPARLLREEGPILPSQDVGAWKHLHGSTLQGDGCLFCSVSGSCHILKEGDIAARMKTKVYVVTRHMLSVFFPVVSEGNIYVCWLCWAFTDVARLSLAEVSGADFFVVGRGLLAVVASLVEHRL